MAFHRTTLAIFSALAIFVAAARLPAAEIEVQDDVQYAEAGGQKLLLDIARPAKLDKPAPCVVFIHGGGWAGGNRKAHHNRMKRAAEEGFVSATVSYRLVKDGQNRWPAQIEDCQAAIRFLRTNAEKHQIDPARFGDFGDSAGAHLSMLLGTIDTEYAKANGETNGTKTPSSKVQAVVGYYGPTALGREFPDAAARIVQNFIGGPVADHKSAYAQASPLTHVNRGDAAMLLFHGTRDELVPHEQAVLMAEKLSESGVDGRVEILIGQRHGWGGKLAEHTERAGLEFFKEVLGHQK